MLSTRFRAGAALTAAALVFAGGCAAQQLKRLEPRLELRAAAQHLAQAKQAGFTVRLDGSADDLIAAVKKQDSTFSADDAKALRTLFHSSATVAYDQTGDRTLLAATVDGVAGTEIRLVDKTLYLKAPVAELAAKFGVDPAEVAEERKDATAETPSAGALFDGRWVAVDLKDFGKLTEGAAGVPTDHLDTAKTRAELEKSATSLFEGASIVRDAADPRHLVVTSSTTKAYAEVKRLSTALGSALGEDALGEEADDLPAAPKERPIVIDVWTDQQKLTAVEVNLLQFVDGAAGRATIRLDVTTGTPITAPTDATKIDTSALTAPGPPTGSATDMAEMLGYDALDRADEAAGKPADHLQEAIEGLAGTGAKAKIVRRGVAQVTAAGGKACLKLPRTTEGEPTVTKGAC